MEMLLSFSLEYFLTNANFHGMHLLRIPYQCSSHWHGIELVFSIRIVNCNLKHSCVHWSEDWRRINNPSCQTMKKTTFRFYWPDMITFQYYLERNVSEREQQRCNVPCSNSSDGGKSDQSSRRQYNSVYGHVERWKRNAEEEEVVP